jgi:hypothetical protein
MSLGSIPDTQGLLFLSQAMNGSLSEQRKSKILIVSHEKENQLNLKAKNLHALPLVPKGKTGAQKQTSLIRTALVETQTPTPKRKVTNLESCMITKHFFSRIMYDKKTLI